MQNNTDLENISNGAHNFLAKVVNYEFPDISNILQLCADLTVEYDESHGVKHHLDVYQNAILIFSDLNLLEDKSVSSGDYYHMLDIIIYSSLLHDTIDHKYPNNLEEKIRKVNEFLNLVDPKAGDIKWIMDNISYSKEAKFGYPIHPNKYVQLARDIVSDADKLEALGEIGLRRCYEFCQVINPNANKSELTKMVVQHCHDKLLKIKDQYIRTVPGKNFATDRHQIIADFVSNNS